MSYAEDQSLANRLAPYIIAKIRQPSRVISSTPPLSISTDQIFQAVLSSDGPGSGLDADTVDGFHASAFSPATHNHSWGEITNKPSTFPPEAHTHSDLVSRDILTSRGDLFVASAASTPTRLGIVVPGPNQLNVVSLKAGDDMPSYQPIFDDTAPETLGADVAAEAGTSLFAARRDHVHPIETSSNPGASAKILATDEDGLLTLNGLIVSGTAATRLVATDSNKRLVSVSSLTSWVSGTTNRVIVNDDGDGTITLSAPQDLHPEATPTFEGVVTSYIAPASDNTSAFQIRRADKSTAVLSIDTTNSRLGINVSSPDLSSGSGLDVGGQILRLRSSRTPDSSSATGNVGEICWDADYIYVCIATDTWRRVALSSW